MTIALITAALAVGYALGRARLGHRASDWAAWLNYQRPPVTRHDYRWWLAQPIYAIEILGMLLTAPKSTIHAWKHRNDPPSPLSPAPVLNPNWKNER